MIITLQKRFFLVSLFFAINSLFGLQIPLASETNENTETTEFDLGTEYLYKLPENDYILGSGDVLNIIVSRDYPELDSIGSIDGEGTINLSLLNRIYVEDLSIKELKKILDKAYLKFVKYPDSEVIVRKYRPIRVMVKGEVQNPGLQTMQGSIQVTTSANRRENLFTTNLQNVEDLNKSSKFNFRSLVNNNQNQNASVYFPTVFDAIRQSGGITEMSDLSKIQVIRKNNLSSGGGKIKTELDFMEVIEGGDSGKNIRIYDQDEIIVTRALEPNTEILQKAVISDLNPRYISVFVAGRVNQPGAKKLSKSSVLNDAIDISGGARTVRGPVTFIRLKNDGTIDKREFRLNKRAKRQSFKNPLLNEGDLIVVGQSFISSTNEIISEFTSPITGIFSTYGLYKAITD